VGTGRTDNFGTGVEVRGEIARIVGAKTVEKWQRGRAVTRGTRLIPMTCGPTTFDTVLFGPASFHTFFFDVSVFTYVPHCEAR
jgi:hypothetical protein